MSWLRRKMATHYDEPPRLISVRLLVVMLSLTVIISLIAFVYMNENFWIRRAHSHLPVSPQIRNWHTDFHRVINIELDEQGRIRIHTNCLDRIVLTQILKRTRSIYGSVPVQVSAAAAVKWEKVEPLVDAIRDAGLTHVYFKTIRPDGMPMSFDVGLGLDRDSTNIFSLITVRTNSVVLNGRIVSLSQLAEIGDELSHLTKDPPAYTVFECDPNVILQDAINAFASWQWALRENRALLRKPGTTPIPVSRAEEVK